MDRLKLPTGEHPVIHPKAGGEHVDQLRGQVVDVPAAGQAVLGQPAAVERHHDFVVPTADQLAPPALLQDIPPLVVRDGRPCSQ